MASKARAGNLSANGPPKKYAAMATMQQKNGFAGDNQRRDGQSPPHFARLAIGLQLALSVGPANGSLPRNHAMLVSSAYTAT